MTESTASAPQAAMTVHLPKGQKALAIGAEPGIGKATAIGPCRVGTDVVGTRYRGLGKTPDTAPPPSRSGRSPLRARPSFRRCAPATACRTGG